ncbi:MAG TPA: tetratricopeptide repeat protein [Candidatus Acidoferrales bacterium]|nr:tetratricopeptide repeat protein [Candidatus Acidoferrales bacterium]
MPAHAQKGGGGSTGGSTGGGGSHGAPVGSVPSRPYPPPIQPGVYPYPNPTMEPGEVIPMQPLNQKPVVVLDEACLPWEVPDTHGGTVSAMRLAVPASARSHYDKACSALKKNKLDEAEQQSQQAIEKYANYSAAWVMLGQVFQQEEKFDEAHDACAKPIHADPTYLPPYLCLAGLLELEKKWPELLQWSDSFQGLNLTGDMYSNYFRALAQYHLQNLAEAQRSISKAIDIDTQHHQPGLIFLLAQIYGQQGDVVDATFQIQRFVKYATTKQEKDNAKEYLSQLESQQKSKATDQ